MKGGKHEVIFIQGGRIAVEGEEEGEEGRRDECEVVGGDDQEGCAWRYYKTEGMGAKELLTQKE